VCARCGRLVEGSGWQWLCRCGGLLDEAGDPRHESVDLGSKVTPLVERRGEGVWLKMEQGQPTGSFKDRGTAVMLGAAVAAGADSVVSDSSGNAGRSVAAHAESAGLACTVYVPASTPADKVAAMKAHDATVIVVDGDRAAAARAAHQRVGRRSPGRDWYASHVFQPSFHRGVSALAAELSDQLGREPGTVAVPAGNGTLILGLWLGFRRLGSGRVPRLVAVQAERCAPLAGLLPSGETAAAGIAIADPPRAGQVRAAVVASGGSVVTVPEDAIQNARNSLAGEGIEVDSTGGTAWAAHQYLHGTAGASRWAAPVVVVLTG
jgi:threonine synthase